MEKKFDAICMGRSSIDLYSQSPGTPFEEIKGFNAYVGGSPLNIAVGCRRLGLQSALLTGVGQDKVGDFILHFLRQEQVDTSLIPVIPGTRSSAVILGIEPPDRFPLVYYRDNCADSQLNIDHVLAANIPQARVLQISATALNKEPTRSASFLAAEIANDHQVPVILDVDFRADQWHDLRAFGVTIRAFLHKVDLVLATKEELLAAFLKDVTQLRITHQQISAPEITGNLDEAIESVLKNKPEALILKTGEKGSRVYLPDGTVTEVPGFPVKVLNVLGAGDAFAAGFIYGYLKKWDWYRCCRMANACGAYLVTQPGCANFTPYEDEILSFIEARGGFIQLEESL
ncbi:MAG: 5-dehydro-2-deoxygluconokinase [Prolixibacteraceae bacterium]